MTDIRDLTWGFVCRAPIAASQAALDDLFADTLKGFGVDRFDCGQVPSGCPTEFPTFLSGRGMTSWEQFYFDQRYCLSDPSPVVCGAFLGAYTWSDVKARVRERAGLRMWSDAGDGGMHEGLIVPLSPRRLTEPVVRLVTSEKQFDPSSIPLLQCMSALYASFTRSFADKGGARPPADKSAPTLSAREIECLHWSARGKTNAEIGVIVNISRSTVNSHIESAKRKLGVNTRVQAAALAHQFGLLSIA